MILRAPTLFLVLTISAFTYADRCRESVAVLGSESGNGSESESVTRDVLIREMALFYSEVLQDRTLLPVFELRLQEMATIERISPETLREEIEVLASNPTVQRDLREEREEQKARERSRLYLALEPYLARLGRADREVIERELLVPGLVTPLSTGEVAFHFRGKHRFKIGNENFYGEREGAMKSHSFGPKNSFAVGQVPVTQLMYLLAALGEEGVDATPSDEAGVPGKIVLHLKGGTYAIQPNHPVVIVSLENARAHARRISKIVGEKYRLPNEIEWEFASRAGSETKYHFGDNPDQLGAYAWYGQNSGGQSHEVGQLQPNGYGLYDTLGNVLEWTSSEGFEAFPPFGAPPSNVTYSVVRGGDSRTPAQGVRSSYRARAAPQHGYRVIGFRLKRELRSDSQSIQAFAFGEPSRLQELRNRYLQTLRTAYRKMAGRLNVFRGTEK
jgi:formylglycine-generating enzyme required for sulfatase activity